MIIIKIILAKSTKLNYMGTRNKTCLVEPVVGSPLLYKCSYIDPYRDINILSI
jgi:hypothetical protein